MDGGRPPMAIAAHSLILITGATSYLASYVIKEFLHRGFRVRGIVRNLSRAAWLTNEVFPSFAQNGTFDLVEIPDLTVLNAFDCVISDAKPSAILHFATPFNFSPDPNKVITQAVNSILNLLHAAARQSSVKRFVYTSSIGAVYSPKGGVRATVTNDSWNVAAVEAAWAPPPYEMQRAPKVYAASKVEAEKAMFEFITNEHPGFVANSVNPFFVIGPRLHKTHLKGTAGWVRNVYCGQPGLFAMAPPGKKLIQILSAEPKINWD
jgi:nucleoside-diphosphate-sugar epimerase